MSEIGAGYEMKTFPLTIDADYEYILAYTNSCEALIYMQNNFIINAG